MAVDGWRIVKIKDIGRVITGRTPSEKHPEHFGQAIPFITPSDMDGCRRLETTGRLLSEDGAEALSRIVIHRGVGVSCIGWQMGKSILIDAPAVTNQQLNTIIPNDAEVDLLFLFYLMSSKRSEIFRLGAGGSRTPILNKSGFEALHLHLPPLPEQRAIAAILGALDDKIELNRRMNETLEAIARTLFTSWFVDFDPVRAKMEGREPAGMNAETATLFPAAFELAHGEEMPAGWRLGSLGDLCDITMGQSPPGNTYNEIGDGLPFYQGIRDFGFRYPRRRIYCSAPTREAAADDVLLSVRAPVGSLNGASERCAIGRGVAALRLKQEHGGYLYYLLKATASGWDKFNAEGTVFGSVSKSGISSFACLVPDASLRRAFSKRVAPIDHHIFLNTIQVDSLSELRDALLPKLLSGEVRVREAERLVEAVV